MGGREDNPGAETEILLGRTLPEARELCPGTHFICTETNGKFAQGEPRIVRVRKSAEGVELVLSRFRSFPDDTGE